MQKKQINSDILLKALENNQNESLLDLTTNKIKQMNLNILKELHLPRDITLLYMKKLQGYRYIDEIQDLKVGSFLKWIPITDPNYLPLNSGGILSEIQIVENGVNLVCKNFMHKYFTLKIDECLVFQKLSTQELVLLSALDHLAK